jgi:hypothetical protein
MQQPSQDHHHLRSTLIDAARIHHPDLADAADCLLAQLAWRNLAFL